MFQNAIPVPQFFLAGIFLYLGESYALIRGHVNSKGEDNFGYDL